MKNTYKTSLNQVPALVKKFDEKINGKVMNYGCGRGWKKVEAFLEGRDVTSYDKYSDDKTINTHPRKKFDMVVCANVLNVIETEEEMKALLLDTATIAPKAFFSVYSGNATGIGKVTTKGYQRNEKGVEYEEILNRYYGKVVRKGNTFECFRWIGA